eukprot:scaffold2202_cov72-Phaeocystis_antarctica.AAC.3
MYLKPASLGRNSTFLSFQPATCEKCCPKACSKVGKFTQNWKLESAIIWKVTHTQNCTTPVLCVSCRPRPEARPSRDLLGTRRSLLLPSLGAHERRLSRRLDWLRHHEQRVREEELGDVLRPSDALERYIHIPLTALVEHDVARGHHVIRCLHVFVPQLHAHHRRLHVLGCERKLQPLSYPLRIDRVLQIRGVGYVRLGHVIHQDDKARIRVGPAVGVGVGYPLCQYVEEDDGYRLTRRCLGHLHPILSYSLFELSNVCVERPPRHGRLLTLHLEPSLVLHLQRLGLRPLRARDCLDRRRLGQASGLTLPVYEGGHECRPAHLGRIGNKQPLQPSLLVKVVLPRAEPADDTLVGDALRRLDMEMLDARLLLPLQHLGMRSLEVCDCVAGLFCTARAHLRLPRLLRAQLLRQLQLQLSCDLRLLRRHPIRLPSVECQHDLWPQQSRAHRSEHALLLGLFVPLFLPPAPSAHDPLVADAPHCPLLHIGNAPLTPLRLLPHSIVLHVLRLQACSPQLCLEPSALPRRRI